MHQNMSMHVHKLALPRDSQPNSSTACKTTQLPLTDASRQAEKDTELNREMYTSGTACRQQICCSTLHEVILHGACLLHARPSATPVSICCAKRHAQANNTGLPHQYAEGSNMPLNMYTSTHKPHSPLCTPVGMLHSHQRA